MPVYRTARKNVILRDVSPYVRGARPLLYGIPPPGRGAPIGLMPSELLSEVFLYARDTADPYGSWTDLLLVCRHWCAVAIATAKLWVELDNSMATTPALESYLLRSALCPLNVTIFGFGDMTTPMPEFMTCLAPHKDRIATLKSLFTCVGFSSLISSLSLPTLRGLRTLSLELTDTCAIVDPTVISLCLEQCSHIRTLEMVNLAVSFEFPQPMNLVKFSLSTVQELPSLVTITSLFRESPNLEVVSLDKYSGISLPRSPREGPADTVTGPPVSMPNLRILSIHAPTRYTRNLLSALSCPQARLQVTLLPVCLHRAVASGFIVSAFPAALKQLDAVDSLLVNLDTLRSDATIVGFNTFAVESLATIQDLMADSSDAPYVFRLTISKGRMPALATSVFHSCVVKALRKFVGSSVLAKKVTRLVMYLPEDPSSLLMGKLVRSLHSLKSVEVI